MMSFRFLHGLSKDSLHEHLGEPGVKFVLFREEGYVTALLFPNSHIHIETAHEEGVTKEMFIGAGHVSESGVRWGSETCEHFFRIRPSEE
jgi:hypothetical protein